MTAPLSFAQQRMWVLQQLDLTSTQYNLPTALRFTGPLNVRALHRAIDVVVARHDILRTTYPCQAGRPDPLVGPVGSVPLPVTDLGASRVPMLDAERVVAAEVTTPFDLAVEPPIRTRLVRLGHDEHVLSVVLHHIACDERSVNLLREDLQLAYIAAQRGTAFPKPALPIQYADFARWQHEQLSAERLEQLLTYWRTTLTDAPQLDLTDGRPRPAGPADIGATVEFDLDADARDALRALSQARMSTPFAAILAAFSVLLHRYSLDDQIVVGTTVSERRLPAAEPLIGCFLNTLVLRTDLSGNPTFTQLLDRVRQATLEAFAHQDLPFEHLVDHLVPYRDPSRHPLFQVAFAYADATGDEDPELPEVRYCAFPTPPTPARFDLTLTMSDASAGLHGAIEYDPRLFDRAQIERLVDHLTVVLRQVTAEPDRRIGELSSPPAAERRVLDRWSAAPAPVPPGTVDERIRRRTTEASEAIALIAGGEQLSYRNLGRRADLIAAGLRRRGVGRGTVVGLYLPRGPSLVAAILGVWRAGGAYLALDVNDPAVRTVRHLRDSRAAIVIGEGAFPVPDGTAVRYDLDEPDEPDEPGLDAGRPVPMHPLAAAYLIYTSGSTGLPKGVVVGHGALNNLAEAQRRTFGVGRNDRVLQFASCTFDAFVSEVAVTLSAGATLVVASEKARIDPDTLVAECAEAAVTVATLPPALLTALHDPLPDGVRTLVAAGERLSAGTARRWASGRRLLNAYGPAEAAVCVTVAEVDGTEPAGPPIGRPVANVRCAVLDGHGRLAPIGAPGELFVAGAGVARGYAGRPDLTAERFIADPFGDDGSRLYRTGDLVRWNADGRLEFLGRADQQTSVRGWRVEPGEVEAALTDHPDVRAAAVGTCPAPGDGQQLVAWLVPADPTTPPAPAILRQYLHSRLPAAMVPETFVIVAALPLTTSGKIDRAALPDPPAPAPRPDGLAGAPPATTIERVIAAIWCDVLGVTEIGRTDDFFHAGGHSLRAIEAVVRTRAALHADVSVVTLFEHPTLAAFAAQVAGGVTTGDDRIPVADRSRPLPLSFAQQRLWFLHQLEPASPEHTVSLALHLRGPLDAAAMQAAVDGLVERHEVLRTTFRSDGDTVEQVVHRSRGLPLPVTDLDGDSAPQTTLTHLLEEEVRRPFDLQADLPIRSRLFRLGPEEHVIALIVHHVVADEQSVAVLIDDLLAEYEAGRRGRPVRLPELPIQYADYATWQRSRYTGPAVQTQLAFWRDNLSGATPLPLPVDRTRPQVRDPAAGWVEFDIPQIAADGVRALARNHDGTVFMVLLAALQAFLARYGDRDDIIVGVPVTGRHRAETQHVVGPFLNLLPIRTDVSGNPTMHQLVDRVRAATLAAYAHQDIPFERLVDEVAPPRDRGRHPLVQVVFNYTAASRDSRTRQCGPLVVRPFSPPSAVGKFDLRLVVDDDAGGLHAALQYRTDLFTAATAERLARHLCTLLGNAVADADRPLHRLPMLTVDEAAPETRSAPGSPPPDVELSELVARHAAEHPDRPAVSDGCRSIDYAALQAGAERLSRRLRAAGVGTDAVVALALPGPVELAVAALGAWRAGAAHLVVDPADPPPRIRHKLTTSRAALIVSTADLLDDLPVLPVPYLLFDPTGDEESGTPGDLDDAEPGGRTAAVPHLDRMAYLVYTSGSTGVPKPVAVTQRGFSGYAHALLERVEPPPGGRWAMVSPLSVDLGLTALAMAWASAGTAYLLDPALARNPAALAAALNEHRVDYLKVTPTQLELLLSAPDAAGALPRLGLFLGGESMPAWLPGRLADLGYAGSLFNHYGPTEATVGAVLHRVTAAPAAAVATTPVPLGAELPMVTGRVLDRHGEPVPPGVPGELCLGGPGLARGYLYQPGETAERFVPDPYRTDGTRLYRTGDRVRRNPDGTLTFLGRVDEQLNLHGLRIEPAEVEHVVASHPEVIAAAVHVRTDGAGVPRLVCWTVPADPMAPPAAADLRAHVAARLPGAMVPALFVFLDSLPITSSGKVDRGALPDPDPTDDGAQDDPPVTDSERALGQIWGELLGVDPIRRSSHFFDLGGHSLLAIRAVSRIRDAIGVDLPLATVFDRPTLAAMAEVVDTLRWIADGAQPSATDDEVEELTL